jgi:hypothetical protein
MKIIHLFLSFLIIAGLIFNFSCKKKPKGPNYTDQQEQAMKLEGTWSISSVNSVPTGVDEALISDLVVTFSIDADKNPSAFSSSGAPDFFITQSTSTWSFSGSTIDVIQLNNVTPVTGFRVLVTDTSLNLTFTFSSTQRTEKLDGNYDLTLTK